MTEQTANGKGKGKRVGAEPIHAYIDHFEEKKGLFRVDGEGHVGRQEWEFEQMHPLEQMVQKLGETTT